MTDTGSKFPPLPHSDLSKEAVGELLTVFAAEGWDVRSDGDDFMIDLGDGTWWLRVKRSGERQYYVAREGPMSLRGLSASTLAQA
jgi:hypothetical protein